MFRDLKAFVLLFVSLFLFFSLNWIYNAICLVFVVLIWFENSAPKDPTDGAEMKWPSVAVPAGSQSYLTARDAGATIFNFQAGKLENNSNSKILDINKQAKMKRLKKKFENVEIMIEQSEKTMLSQNIQCLRYQGKESWMRFGHNRHVVLENSKILYISKDANIEKNYFKMSTLWNIQCLRSRKLQEESWVVRLGNDQHVNLDRLLLPNRSDKGEKGNINRSYVRKW